MEIIVRNATLESDNTRSVRNDPGDFKSRVVHVGCKSERMDGAAGLQTNQNIPEIVLLECKTVLPANLFDFLANAMFEIRRCGISHQAASQRAQFSRIHMAGLVEQRCLLRKCRNRRKCRGFAL